jgi:hypothetical protein
MSFDGVWQGVIHFDKEAFLSKEGTPADGTTFRIEIHGPVVRVFYIEPTGPGELQEFMPGAFHIAPVISNAVIFGTHFAPPSSLYWVETWVFTTTLKDQNTLLVQYSRVVNNVGMPPDQDGSKFATRGYGEFKRVSP